MSGRIGTSCLALLVWTISLHAQSSPGELWSLRPVARPNVPVPRDQRWSWTAIDDFLLARMESQGIHPSADADPRTWIRRVTYDLSGLPPTPEEIDAFLGDNTPQARRRVVDRLLASPSYGERWGRHWLDVVRYADTAGDNSDYPIPQMYRYRNWVIDSFNRHLPYDEFVRQQLSGDLLPASSEADRREKLIATGYLANARRFGSYEEERYPWYLTIEDTIDNLGRTFLGLTINCCRCHDHKFDPLTQQDYYALYGFFSSTRYPRPGIELDKVQRDFVPLVPDEVVRQFQEGRKKSLSELEAKLKDLNRQKAEAEKTGDVEGSKRAAQLAEEIKKRRQEKEAIDKQPLPYETAYAVAEGSNEGKRRVGDAKLQIRGDPERLGPEVPRRFPAALGGFALKPEVRGSGRLELAAWITDPRNPLFARVMVNRIWQYHFGRGLVPTASDFGMMGQPPTHPELLDWLATRFVESGYSIEEMHRLILSSRVYQLSSRVEPAVLEHDPDNQYLARFERRRLDSESIRDTLLWVSGKLDRSPGGPHPFPEPKTWNFTQHNPFKAVYDTNRRSVYLMTQRIQRHPFLGLFDGADTNASTATRTSSITSIQSLFLMNDPFVHAQARGFAGRLIRESDGDSQRIQRAFVLLLGREPTAKEADAAQAHLVRVRDMYDSESLPQREVHAWESLARALFLSNELVHLE